ncbi:hypothetical protein BKA93DRAFT_724854, partial [Sparassis latifolia]
AFSGPFFVAFPNLRNALDNNIPIRTKARSCTILPNFVGIRFQIHNGKDYVPVLITQDMVGHKLGEFAMTKKRFTYKCAKHLSHVFKFGCDGSSSFTGLLRTGDSLLSAPQLFLHMLHVSYTISCAFPVPPSGAGYESLGGMFGAFSAIRMEDNGFRKNGISWIFSINGLLLLHAEEYWNTPT